MCGLQRYFSLLGWLLFGLGAVAAYADEQASAGLAETLPLPPPATAALTLADLEQMALQSNPTLVQAGAAVRNSRGKALQAGLYPNPTVGYTSEQIGAEGTAGELHGLFVQQEIVTAGKLQLSRSKYQQEVRQAQLRVVAQQFRVLSSVRLAFYEVLARERQVEIRRGLLANAEDALTTTRGLLNVGQANRADLLQAEVENQRSRVALNTAERRWQGSWEELAAVVGMPDLPPAPLVGQLEIDETCILDRDAALYNLIETNPRVQAARVEVMRDRIAIQRERVEPIPNLNVRAESGYNFASEDTVAGFSVGVRLPIFDKNQGSIIQAQAELARAQADVVRIELDLRKQFAETFAEYESALATTRTYREETLPMSREAYELYLDAFKNRRAAWPQVLVAQREYFQLSEEYLDNLVEVRRAEIEINSLFLGDGLDQPPGPTPQGHLEATPRPR
jgi:cobalt-zinc-cadmium efflux system outer membrane protein